MKTNCCELLLSFLLAFAIITNALLGGAAAASDPVLDLEGEVMQVIDYYYIERHNFPYVLPTMVASLASGGNETCPPYVAEVPLYGIPAWFLPVNSTDSVVRESTDLNIKFDGLLQPQCYQSNVWKVQYDEEFEEYFVRVGGVEGNPGCETITNWFKIEKLGDHYKLVFCPSVCKSPYCKPICKNVGLDSQNRFVLSHTPTPIVFRKAGPLKSMISYQY